MDRQSELGLDREELHRLGLALSALADMREEEILSICRQILDTAFPDSIGHDITQVLIHAREPLRLREIAVRCASGRRSILPYGRLRIVIERLVAVGMVINHGTPEKPRYSLDRNDPRVQTLVRMYGPVQFAFLKEEIKA